MTAPMLPHRMTKGYGEPFGQVVESVNGTEVQNLRHLVETLRDCKDEFLTIPLRRGRLRDAGLPPQGDARRDRAADEPERHPATRKRRRIVSLDRDAGCGPLSHGLVVQLRF